MLTVESLQKRLNELQQAMKNTEVNYQMLAGRRDEVQMYLTQLLELQKTPESVEAPQEMQQEANSLIDQSECSTCDVHYPDETYVQP